ncbi:SusC/RagA family TonB-linked outer membrane protein [uncultured Lacinutrix sp.]|uniref:SusC/RagA family TonB-linked outer membrane protein n=1 Tax=uncultured Lacinutrix sp. TaxID=574032 RepID=UPI00261D4837|nr:SusC/RagA family TonB-linked outer membrane protein [uncultured Lacinutrix sp.]
MKTILNSLLFALVFLPSILIAQNTISGSVTEQSSSLPLPGVNVLVKGTNNGTATDFDGNYEITVNTGDIIEFSYVGYLTQEISYTGQTTLNIILANDTSQLDEVVIIGYGSVKKEDLTGSVDVVSSKEFNKGAILTTDQLITGKAAGVRITNNGGSPDSAPNIRIRGGASLSANSSPLIVIDGIPIGNQNPAGVSNPLALVNPNDVESFTILKDASATAIYGSRASNGVIIITTKKGTSGDIKFNFSTDATVSSAGEGLNVMGSENYVRFIQEYYPDQAFRLGVPVGSVSTNQPVSQIIQVSIFDENGDFVEFQDRAIYDTNWKDQVFRTAFTSNTHFSVRTNLGESIPFRASVGYNNAEGVVRTDDYERFSGSLRLSPKLLNDNLKIDVNAKATFVDKNNANTGGAIDGALRFDPTKPILDNNSIFNGYYVNSLIDNAGIIQIQGRSNPVTILEERTRPERALRLLGNIELDYKLPFINGLKAVVNLGLDASKVKIEERFTNNALSAFGIDTDNANAIVFNPGVNYRERQDITNTTLDGYLLYNKELDNSFLKRFDIQGGYSYQNFKTDGNQDRFINNPTTGVRELNIDPQNPTNRYFNELNLQSFFGRANLDIADQLLITLSLRADGSSLFSEDNRWGYFPAGAVAWKLNKLSFINDSKYINDLKLRLGYGKTGQQDITGNVGFYPSTPFFAAGNQNSQYLPGVFLYSALPFNPDLTWEKTDTYNLGLDFDFFQNNIITGSFDIFKRETTDLLARVAIPPGQFLTNEFVKNVGSTESEGFELSLGLNPIQSDNLNISLNGNLAYAKTEITDLQDITTLRAGGSLTGTGSNLYFNNVGREIREAAVFKQIYDANGNPIPGAFADLNGDNVITDDDKYLVKTVPNWTFGFGFNVSYKNWDFSSTFRGQLDGKTYNFNTLNFGNRDGAIPTRDNSLANVLDFYEGESNIVFEDVIQNKQYSDYYLEDAAFLRCENIVLGYQFKDNFIKNTRMRLYAAVNNPFIITEYSGQDPENFGGIDNNFYPRPTAYTFGINLDF